MKLLTIIIPTRNEEFYLPKLLKSIQKQTFKDFKIVVADANSTDRTKRIAKLYRCKIVQGGYPDIARNNGAKKANTPFLCFIDSDIILQERLFLEKALNEFNKRNLDIATPLQKPMRVRNYIKNIFYKTFIDISNFLMIAAENTKSPFMQSVMLMKKRVHKDAGGFPPYEFGEDSAFLKKAVSLGYKFGVLRTVTPYYISPRRFENKGILKMLIQYIYFNGFRIFGHEFVRGKTKSRYHEKLSYKI